MGKAKKVLFEDEEDTFEDEEEPEDDDKFELDKFSDLFGKDKNMNHIVKKRCTK